MKKQFISLQKFKLTTGQIDRRQFVMSALAAGVVLPSALSMADKAMAATPNKGGIMRYGVGHGSTTDSLDSGTFENTHIPTLLNTYGDAFEANVFQSGLPGSDTRWYIKLYKGYRMVTSDGTFVGGDGNETVSYNGVDYTCYLWEGATVTGANTSHNGGTSVSLRRDDGI